MAVQRLMCKPRPLPIQPFPTIKSKSATSHIRGLKPWKSVNFVCWDIQFILKFKLRVAGINRMEQLTLMELACKMEVVETAN